MLDFLRIVPRNKKDNQVEIVPKFVIKKSQDLMIRGGDFYAIWIEELGLWSTEEQDALDMIDRELEAFTENYKKTFHGTVTTFYLWDASSGMIDGWHKYCQKQMRDNFSMLDEKLIFSNTETNKKDYASKRLTYPIEAGECPAYEKIMSTLYTEGERHKLEWAIGSIVSGESKKIQKFMVLYGSAGTGKSTILNIIQQLFEGYYSVFDAKALGSASSQFALEAFRNNPLVAIQHDGDLSKIEDNTRLNSLVSHETMTINEKFKASYENRFKCFLFMGTNRPVKITDAKSGLLRRLIDVSPSGNKLSPKEYKKAVKQVSFELGAIAYHCREVFLEDPGAYDDYVPTAMMSASNDFYNFVIDSYSVFKKDNSTTAKAAWEMYKLYVEDAKVPYPFSQRTFKEELKNYFRDYQERVAGDDGNDIRGYYTGFRTEKFEDDIRELKPSKNKAKEESTVHLINFDAAESIFDKERIDCFAQYASSKGTPMLKWDDVKTTLKDIDTRKLHYVKVPENHIVIDFDIRDESGNKCLAKNIEEASKWPATYAEFSQSGNGVHLHYIYSGDVNKLSRVYDENIEVKVFTGKSSLRRKLTKCNDLPIATISSGLPLKGDEKLVNWEGIKNEKMLRIMIKKNLNKEYHGATKPSVDFIYDLLEDAYSRGIGYDVSDLYNAVFAFAANSTNQSEYCMKKVDGMKFKSEEPSAPEVIDNSDDGPLVFYDVEVFPNLFLVNWKMQGEGKQVVRMINPSPKDIEGLLKYKLVGYNCRRYDNHMLYGRLIGYTNEQLYNLSQSIINAKKGENRNCFFGEAYNLSYTDIYDFASAGNKKSLKKLEIEMGIHHQELGLPWDKPVPEDQWIKVAEYCDNDVIATEAAFNYLKGDWIARQILADITGMTVNDTTNTLSQRSIFGKNTKPQSEFNYRNLAEPVGSDRYEEYKVKFGSDYQFRVFNADGMPEYRDYIPGEHLPAGWSILPFFPGYTFEYGKSTYLGAAVGEGGRVYSEPGMYGNVWDGDVTGMHPSSIIAEVLFGPRYTKAFADIVSGRVSIKHEAWHEIDNLFDGKLKPYIEKVINGELKSKELANALKTVVNSVYGLTSAAFENPCRDPRNKDNIVAKRGALFMTLLTSEVQKRGFTVCHNKTDSIKVPDATEEIKDFIIKFGKEYGYSFETEAEFDRFCLVNDAVYIAKTKDGEWTATGKQFAVPYVFKTLFSKEPIGFNDMCETFAVTKGDLYLDFNENLPDVSDVEKELEKYEKLNAKIVKETGQNAPSYEEDKADFERQIAEGHNYQFVGRVGQFCPIKPGYGGGVLYRVNDGKYYAAPGSTGYRWLESEAISKTIDGTTSIIDEATGKRKDIAKMELISGNEDIIDRSFYNTLVDDAIDAISKYGDFEWFVSDDPYIGPKYDQRGAPIYYPTDDDDDGICPFDVR